MARSDCGIDTARSDHGMETAISDHCTEMARSDHGTETARSDCDMKMALLPEVEDLKIMLDRGQQQKSLY
ncbi:hypothetical protein NDU88_008240 [Pleurodeles waltl]|uniref:Uncharacterized protein n=1 Tax=Pleurodeles waltl TaxID=8319 RepID=A0AAV7U242_PLEWA|nr:hypothetical protein NDU88_008240 [Pleurodeles waltl]